MVVGDLSRSRSAHCRKSWMWLCMACPPRVVTVGTKNWYKIELTALRAGVYSMSIKQATTEGNKMNTSTATAPKIKLQRGMAGWYVYYSRNNTFDIHKVAPGMWTVRHQVGHRENATAETWTVSNLDAARALIASLI